MTAPDSNLDPKLKKLIRQDVQSMHAYAIQDAAGMVKLDAMENPHRLPAALQAELGQRTAQVINTTTWVTIERQRAQALTQPLLQLGAQAVRVFHRVQLDQTRSILNCIGVHGLNVLTKAVFKRRAQKVW